VGTRARVARVIEEKIAFRYSKRQVTRLLRDLGWTPQIAIRRALQREEAIERWRVEVWPRLKQQAKGERGALIIVGQSAFYLVPGVVKTYSPRG
jgi:hypothetical protein